MYFLGVRKMPKFGDKSEAQLITCHSAIQKVLRHAILYHDFSVHEGKRSEEKQRDNVRRGVSQTMNSNHVYPLDGPSLAADVLPYPFRGWPENTQDTKERMLRLKEFHALVAFILGVAHGLGVHNLRSGMDWDGDWDFTDQQFHDLPHLELV